MSSPQGGVPGLINRFFQRPGVLGAALVAGTLALAAALAYQAVRAAASHRAAVETALEHHATTAAWRFAPEARSWLGYGMNAAGDMLQHEIERQAELPGPDVLRRVLAQKDCDCMTAAFGRTFLRLVIDRDAPLEVRGEPLSERSRDELRATMQALATDPLMRPGHQWRMLPPGSPRLNRGTDAALLWRVNDKARRPRAIYGMVVEQGQLARPLGAAFAAVQFFPAAVVPASVASTLVRMEVAGPNAATEFASGPDSHRFSGSDTLGTEYGRLVATASINPAAAAVLISGGLPSSRVPMILALLVLALAIGAAAALVSRREHRLSRLREDFVGGVSHELRTPLTQIRMLSELLETDSFKSPAERSRAVGVIHRESLRLTNLVDNVLEFSRLRRSGGASGTERISLGEVLREVAESLAPLLETLGSRVDVIAPDDMEVRGDRDALARVFRNLIENAAKYGPTPQTIRMTVTRGSGGSVRVTVDDEGPGIPAAERARIWQPYYRLDRDRNAPAGGSGLGLSVVAEVVRMLGGTVSVADAPSGKGGARFTVELPGVS